jgi:hypothetical protein
VAYNITKLLIQVLSIRTCIQLRLAQSWVLAQATTVKLLGHWLTATFVRAYATNQAGTSYGQDELFASVGVAPPIATERNTIYTTRTPTISVSPVTNFPPNYPYQLFVYIQRPGTDYASRLAVARDRTATQPASTPLEDGNYIARSAIKVGTTREAISTEDIPFSVNATH